MLVHVTMDTTPNTAFRLEFFAGTETSDLGFGEGGVLVGVANATSDGSGAVDAAVSLPLDAVAERSITATATNASGNTSEFSLSIALDASWDLPDPNAGPNPPPRNLVIARPGTGPAKTSGARAPRDLLGFNVYRRSGRNFQADASSRFQSQVPMASVATFALSSGSFFRITAVYSTGESAPTDAVPGGVPPLLSSIRLKGAKIVADGAGFTTPLVVLLDGIPFVKPAKVKKANTRVLQKDPLLIGTIASQLDRQSGVGTVMIRTSDGGTAIRRIMR
jgi:hypothetical protein